MSMAHACRDQVLAWGCPALTKAFDVAKEKGQYEKVCHVNGKLRKAYALTDYKEYFAEVTEAWFGCDVFYPFARPELKDLEPRLYEVLAVLQGAGCRLPYSLGLSVTAQYRTDLEAWFDSPHGLLDTRSTNS